MDKPVDELDDAYLDEMERRALLAAVAEALADTRPDTPHEVVEREAALERAELLKKLAALSAE